MPWPTWDQAAAAAVLSAVLWLGLRQLSTRRLARIEPAAAEFALVAALYSVWRLARMLPIASTEGAIQRGYDINRLQVWMHLPSELSLERVMLRHDWLTQVTTWYYASVHVPALIAFLVWMFVRHRDQYPHWRNGLALVTLGCLVIRFIRVAPPRFLYDLGYTNLAGYAGPSVYGSDVSKGVSDQFAAMPSIHVAWAAVVSFGVVAATANHWWLDGVVAILLLVLGLRIDSFARSRLQQRSQVREPALLVEDRDVVTAEPVDR